MDAVRAWLGANVHVAVDTEHHLIVAQEVTNAGLGQAQLNGMAQKAKQALQVNWLDPVADRGYYSGEQIPACERAGIAVTLPRPMTSGAKTAGRFDKEDCLFRPGKNAYHCPAGETLPCRYTTLENGMRLSRYWTNACQACPLKTDRTTGRERRVTRWEHEHLLESVQRRLDADPQAIRVRRETVEHPFGTLKERIGATHFLTRTLPRVSAEMVLQVPAYNLTRVLNIMGSKGLLAAIAG